MKTHEELVQTARVLHKALKVDLTIYDGDRDCIVKFTKNPYPEELCGKLWDHPEKMYESEGHRGGRELLSVSRTISDGALFRAACLENSS